MSADEHAYGSYKPAWDGPNVGPCPLDDRGAPCMLSAGHYRPGWSEHYYPMAFTTEEKIAAAQRNLMRARVEQARQGQLIERYLAELAAIVGVKP